MPGTLLLWINMQHNHPQSVHAPSPASPPFPPLPPLPPFPDCALPPVMSEQHGAAQHECQLRANTLACCHVTGYHTCKRRQRLGICLSCNIIVRKCGLAVLLSENLDFHAVTLTSIIQHTHQQHCHHCRPSQWCGGALKHLTSSKQEWARGKGPVGHDVQHTFQQYQGAMQVLPGCSQT